MSGSSFAGNSAEYGGAISRLGTDSVFTITGSTFSGNTAAQGGAILSDAMEVSYSTFTGNSVTGTAAGTGDGGAIYTAESGADLTVNYCTVTGNSATQRGGGIYASVRNLKVYQSLIADNTAAEYGAGLYNNGSGSATITWSTLANNTYTDAGSGSTVKSDFYNYVTSAVVKYSILLNADYNGDLSYEATLFSEPVYHSGTFTKVGEHWKVYDPRDYLFADAAHGDYTLVANSQAINGTYVTPEEGHLYDLAGGERLHDVYCDYGAYEVHGTPETPSMVVTTYDDVVNKWDNVISLREALTVYYGTGGGTTVTFAEELFDANRQNGKTGIVTVNANSTFALSETHNRLVIDGNERIVFDGETFRLFFLSGSADVTFDGLTFQNINTSATSSGSVFAGMTSGTSAASVVKFKDSTFTNNTGSDAGAILVSNLSLDLDNCTFTGNKGVHGAAAYVATRAGTVTVTDSTFENNEANDGGALQIRCETGAVSVTGSHFTGNKAKVSEGGALCIALNGQDVTVQGNEFTGNSAELNGGAVFFGTISTESTSNVRLEGNTFDGNSTATGNGGAVYGNVTTVKNNTFRNNTASNGYGGAFYGNISHIEGSTFEKNKANNGGAVFGDDITITGSTFTENTATVRGGAVMSTGDGSFLSFVDTTFTKNTAGGAGGAVWGYEISVAGSAGGLASFSQNKAGSEGGAIFARSDVTLDNVGFEKNAAGTSGGAVYEMESGAKITVTGGSFKQNHADNGSGGAVYCAEIAVDGTSFTGNYATVDGGALYLHDSTSTVKNATFTENHTTNFGGAINTTGAGSVLDVTNSRFDGNEGYHGGAIRNTNGTLNVHDSYFTANSAARGLAIHSNVNGSVTLTYVYDSQFVENDARGISGSRGTVLANHGELYVYNSEFTRNKADESGAGVLGQNAEKVYIEGSTFTGNTVNRQGGAIYQADGELTVKDSTFTGNKSGNQGGAVNVYRHSSSTSATFENCTFVDNEATGNGGAILNRGGSVTMNYCTVTGNKGTSDTSSYGGAAYVAGGSFKLYQSLVADNSAHTFAGGIYLTESASLDVSWSTIVNNTVTGASYYPDIYINSSSYYNYVSYSIVGSAYGNSRLTLRNSCYGSSSVSTSGSRYVSDINGLFVDSTAEDYHNRDYRLLPDTQAVDWISAGVDGPGVDLAGNVRPNGLAYDSGAYEYYDTTDTPSMTVTTADDRVDPNDGVVSLREALTVYYRTDGGTAVSFADGIRRVYLNSGITLDSTYDYDGLVIDGGGHVVFEGLSDSVFNVSAAADITFSGLTFRNLRTDADGSAIAVTGISDANGKTVTVDNCVFENNVGRLGGAIAVLSPVDLVVTGSLFNANRAVVLDTVGGAGGAVYTAAGNAEISGSTFTGNTADRGGAVYTAAGSAEISGSTFTGNTAGGAGGAVYTAAGSAEIGGSTFTGNTADRGGAVYSAGGTARISDSILTGNTAAGTSADANAGNGGAICAQDASLTVYQSLVAGNKASGYGGGVCFAGNASIDVSWSTMANNTAEAAEAAGLSGRDLYVADSGATGSLSTSIFLAFDVTSGVGTSAVVTGAADELFADPESGNYTLKEGSGAIDASGVTSGDPTVDLAGDPRGIGEAYDCGAFEYQGASPAELPYSDAADAAFASLDDDDLAVDFNAF